MLSYLVDAAKYLVNRPILRARVFVDTAEGELQVEIENVGGRPTSLVPEIGLVYWVPEKGRLRRRTATLAVGDVDRELPPFKARVFGATADGLHPGYPFSWFRTYGLRTTTGHWIDFHVRNALLEPLSVFRFHWELLQYRIRGRLNGVAPTTIEDMRSQRRRIGPF